MLCPLCRSGRCRRSRRQSWRDYAISVIGLRPWRCRTCAIRFFAWSVAFAYLRYTHCRRCGNLDLQRVSRNHVDGRLAWLGRMVRLPAYRCSPCRSRFFSVLPYRRIHPIDEETFEPEEARQPTPAGTD